MKTFILSIIASSLLFIGCYDDKGNYDYTDLSTIDISGIDEEYSRISFKDTLRITPTVTSSDANDTFEYLWTLNPSYKSVPSGGSIESDTIGNEQTLNYPVKLSKGMYDVVLKLTNSLTGYSTFHTTSLEVKTEFSLGFYVLKDVNGNTDMDLHLPDGGVSESLITQVEGQALPGAPRSMGIIFQYSYIDPATDEYAAPTALSVCAGKDARVYNLQDMSIMFTHETMFFGAAPTDETPYYIYPNCYGIGYLSDKGSYFNYQFASSGMNSAGKFGYPTPISNGCRPNINCMYNSLGEGQYAGGCFYFFDEQNRRFLECNFNGDLNAFEDGDTPVPENYDLAFLGRNAIGEDCRGYALFKDKQASGKLYLYLLTLDYTSYMNPVKKVGEIPATSDMNRATLYAINERDVRVMYFVADNKLYMFDIEQQTETNITPTDLAGDEEITYISNRYWKGENDLPNNFNYLTIATYKDGKYKVYMYNITGGQPVGKPQRLLKGEGKAVKMQFSSPKMSQNPMDGACYPVSY